MRYDEISALCIRAEKIKAMIGWVETIDISEPVSLWELQKKIDVLKEQLEILNQAIKNEITQ